MSYTIKDIFKWYKKGSDNPVKTEAEFRNIWGDYMQLVMDDIILEGGYITLPGRMGEFMIVRKERNPKHPMPNWEAINKAKREGTYTGVIYHMDEEYVRFLWRKSRCIVKNKSIWHFKPTRGDKGLKTKLRDKLRDDDLAFYNFRRHGNI